MSTRGGESKSRYGDRESSRVRDNDIIYFIGDLVRLLVTPDISKDWNLS